MELNTVEVKDSLLNVSNGIKRYKYIMDNLFITDVSKDVKFQKTYTYFYKIRRNKETFLPFYYNYIEENKSNNIKFEDVLVYFFNKTNRMEASFSSKLLATINPNMPVWDSIVLKKLSLKVPANKEKNRILKIVHLYSEIVLCYENYLTTQNAKDVVNVFDEVYPDLNFSDVKKIDFAIWSLGKN